MAAGGYPRAMALAGPRSRAGFRASAPGRKAALPGPGPARRPERPRGPRRGRRRRLPGGLARAAAAPRAGASTIRRATWPGSCGTASTVWNCGRRESRQRRWRTTQRAEPSRTRWWSSARRWRRSATRSPTLPDRERTALLLRAEGFGNDDVAATLGVSRRIARKLAERGRARLTHELQAGDRCASIASTLRAIGLGWPVRGDRRARLDEHLAHCVTCRATVAELRREGALAATPAVLAGEARALRASRLLGRCWRGCGRRAGTKLAVGCVAATVCVVGVVAAPPRRSRRARDPRRAPAAAAPSQAGPTPPTSRSPRPAGATASSARPSAPSGAAPSARRRPRRSGRAPRPRRARAAAASRRARRASRRAPARRAGARGGPSGRRPRASRRGRRGRQAGAAGEQAADAGRAAADRGREAADRVRDALAGSAAAEIPGGSSGRQWTHPDASTIRRSPP